MNNSWRALDNTAKVFSLENKKNINTFRLSVILKETIDSKILKSAIIKTLEVYPSYGVKLKNGFFWNYLATNIKEPLVEKEYGFPCKRINLKRNNDYLFKVTYFNKKINLDVFHVLTDGSGAIIFFKELIYTYLNLKYELTKENIEVIKNIKINEDQYVKNANKKLLKKSNNKKAYLIQEKSNLLKNKTYHYIINLEKFKTICKNYQVSITEFLTAIYILALYKTIYDKNSNKDLSVAVPVDLRKYYNVETFSNFFVCMNIDGNVTNTKEITFRKILNQVHNEFKNKLEFKNLKNNLAKEVKLGTNFLIHLVPLFIKKSFMNYFEKHFSQAYTTTLSNLGAIDIKEKYKKYIDNIMVLVNSGNIQKVKCSICSFANKLTVTLNSNLITNKIEKEFYKLLEMYIGNIKLVSNTI